jgi:SAM-dependent methyltransferase
MQSPEPSDSWHLGNPYERYVGRWSRRVAPIFLGWLGVPDGKRWLDVGCGTGALCAAIVERCAPASLTGIEPSEGFLKVARESLPSQVTLSPGDASAIPLPDKMVDAVVSGLVLNFIPNLSTAFREMARVAKEGATFGAYVWDYAGKMEFMRHFWDAVVALDPAASRLDEGLRFPLCRPEELLKAMRGGGFQDAEVTAIEIPTLFANFQDLWEPFLGGQGPAPAYVMSLTESGRSALKEKLNEQLPFQADGSIQLIARAWAVRAMV